MGQHGTKWMGFCKLIKYVVHAKKKNTQQNFNLLKTQHCANKDKLRVWAQVQGRERGERGKERLSNIFHRVQYLLTCDMQQAHTHATHSTSCQFEQFMKEQIRAILVLFCRPVIRFVRVLNAIESGTVMVGYHRLNRTIIDVNSPLLLLQAHIRLINSLHVLNSLWPLINLLLFMAPLNNLTTQANFLLFYVCSSSGLIKSYKPIYCMMMVSFHPERIDYKHTKRWKATTFAKLSASVVAKESKVRQSQYIESFSVFFLGN